MLTDRLPDPFSVTANPATYGPRPATEHAIGELESLLRDGSQALVLTGPSGIGKTLVLRVLGERLAGRFVVVHLPYPYLRFNELCAWGLGSSPDSLVSPVDQFDRLVVDQAARGGAVLLLIDEAHRLPAETVSALEERLAKFGPALRAVCAATVTRQRPGALAEPLWREVPLREPMSEADTLQFLNGRLARSGVPSADRFYFRVQLAEDIHREAEGNPGRVLELAGRAWFEQIVRGRDLATQPHTRQPAAAPPPVLEPPRAAAPASADVRPAGVGAGAASVRAGLAEIRVSLMRAVRSRIRALGTGISGSVHALVARVAAALGSLRDAILGSARALRNALAATARTVRDAILGMVRAVRHALLTTLRAVRDTLLATVRALRDVLRAVGRAVRDASLATTHALQEGAAWLGRWTLRLIQLPMRTPRSVVAGTAGMAAGAAIALGILTLRPELPGELLGGVSALVEARAGSPLPAEEPRAPLEPVVVERAAEAPPAPPVPSVEAVSAVAAPVAAVETEATSRPIDPDPAPPEPAPVRVAAPAEPVSVAPAHAAAKPAETSPAAAVAMATPEVTRSVPIAVTESESAEAQEPSPTESEPIALEPAPVRAEPVRAAPVRAAPPAEPVSDVAVVPAPQPVVAAPVVAAAAPAPQAARVEPIPAEPAAAVPLPLAAAEAERAAPEAQWEPDPGLAAQPSVQEPAAFVPAEAGPVVTVAAPVPSVAVNVNAVPWATIEVDGRQVGETPLADLLLSEGEHRFIASFPDGRRVERLIEVSAENRHVLFE